MTKVTVVGAGKYGSTTAQRLAAADIADEIVLTDIVDGLPQGLALDMNQSRPLERYRSVVTGTNDYADTAGSDVVVITAGLPRKPGMTRMDLLEVNAKIVAGVTREIMQHSPDPVLVVVTNPLDHMTTLAAEVSGLPKSRVMGQAGNLHTVLDVEALTLGSHGPTMVPVPSQCFVGGKPVTEILDGPTIDALIERTRDGGAEIVGLLKTGSAYYAPSAAAAKMVRAVLEDSGERMPVCAWVTGEYGIDGVYLGVPARIGAGGVTEIVELDLTSAEREALSGAADEVRRKVGELEQLDLG
jgi:malate dehydrogenase